ncbi:hypothetical protein [Desulfotomaculum copahuensis]|uniref:Uncharacterized protein n=1 Tax=Desulfotomaculum copahuensis TaxID=1838280 RepID=A0A1B7LI66_9FIRM|nr:hypothetical protein [Desulfotomaculum copahuensis]OAT86109.1 hypothetical protein A6M21_04115 [Desulfotomaculum copahuensis]
MFVPENPDGDGRPRLLTSPVRAVNSSDKKFDATVKIILHAEEFLLPRRIFKHQVVTRVTWPAKNSKGGE